jgi:membrane protein YdbS with pleckstrin-like domain
MDLPGKQPDEKVLMTIRKHPIVYIRISVVFFLTAIVPSIIFIIVWANNFPVRTAGNTGVIGLLAALIFILYALAIFLIAWLDEEFDLFVLTNKRLIDITQVGFLKRKVATTPLNQIQDTTSDISGILGTVLNYGQVDVQTAAGNASDFTIDHIPDPALVARSILEVANQKKGGEDPSHIDLEPVKA